jgi:exopolysaccharide biosynthesis polyprenyl glycosylphosphotransferase
LDKQIVRVIQFVFGIGVSMAFVAYTLKLEVSRPLFFGFLLLSGVFLVVGRVLFVWILRSRTLNEHNETRILIVGFGKHGVQLGRELERYRQWGFKVVGYVTTNPDCDFPDGAKILGTLEDLPHLIGEEAVADEIVFVGRDLTDLATLDAMIHLCGELGIKTRVAADFFPSSVSRASMDFIGELPLITFSMVPEHSLEIVAKRIIDFVVAALAILALSPVMLLTAAAIKFTTPGPVFYRQERCGRFGRPFTLTKFRTMVDGAEDRLWEIRHLNEMSGPVFKMRNDPRVTPLGRFLRKFSVDELPQFWNVIKGEMSVVGPRAPLPEEVEHYSNRQKRRLSVRPGITCLWQVSGRSEIDFQKWMDLDLQYIDNWSLWLDFRIMMRTVPAVFTGRGAR